MNDPLFQLNSIEWLTKNVQLIITTITRLETAWIILWIHRCFFIFSNLNFWFNEFNHKINCILLIRSFKTIINVISSFEKRMIWKNKLLLYCYSMIFCVWKFLESILEGEISSKFFYYYYWFVLLILIIDTYYWYLFFWLLIRINFLWKLITT